MPDIDFDSINAELRRKAEEAGAAIPEGDPCELPPDEFLTDAQITALANALAEGTTQTRIAELMTEQGDPVTQRAVSKMLAGEPGMIDLAVRWIEMAYPSVDPDIEFERGERPEGKPRGPLVRYFKMQYIRQASASEPHVKLL